MNTLNILGCGKVGGVFGRLFAQGQQFQIQDVLNRSLASSTSACELLGSGTARSRYDELRPAKVWMLSLADDQILPACEALMARQVLRAGDIVFHCSGALASEQMQLLRGSGVQLASVHPVRSFADSAFVLAHFAGTFCSVEGDSAALDVLISALQAIGAQTLLINAQQKSLYHAASVFACNYLSSLLDVAMRAWQQAGIAPEQAQQLAQPLVRETMENIFRLGPAKALSGPIARGDWQTVAKQQQAVQEWDAAAGDLYRAFTATTTQLAQRKQAGE